MTVRDRSGGAKVLFLSGLQVYPPQSGGHLRSFALANALAHHGFDVFVYSLVGRKNDYRSLRPSSTQTWPEGIEEYVDRRALGFLVQYASYALALPPVWLTGYFRAVAASPGEILLPALLRAKLSWCDIVVADFPFVHPVFAAPSARGRRRVLSTHNVEHHMYDDERRWQHRWTRGLVRKIEIDAARACDVLVSCCTSDKEFFEAHARVPQSVLVPNGTDVRRFVGMETHREHTRKALGITDDVKVFLFTASKWGPNREAFDYLLDFAARNREQLVEQGVHVLVVGNVTTPTRRAGLTATGKVDVVEPYFAAADAALNPIVTGAGTNVKMGEYIAARLPIVTTPFGARGFRIEDGRTGIVFERDALGSALSRMRRLFDEDPARLRRMTEDAYAENESGIDMDTCVSGLVQALSDKPPKSGSGERGAPRSAPAPSGSWRKPRA
jgi:glycosyltransferase involved in cell wall biosynthesis